MLGYLKHPVSPPRILPIGKKASTAERIHPIHAGCAGEDSGGRAPYAAELRVIEARDLSTGDSRTFSTKLRQRSPRMSERRFYPFLA